MIHDGNNETSWETFCAREGRRLARRNRDWASWLEESDEEDVAGEAIRNIPETRRTTPDESRMESQEPPEPSLTLETQPRERTNPKTEATTSNVPAKSVETTARRSIRIQRLTEKGMHARGEKKKRTYQRKEKATRTIVKRTVQPSAKKNDENFGKTFSFCIQIERDEPEEVEIGTLYTDGNSSASYHRPNHTSEDEREDTNQGGTPSLTHQPIQYPIPIHRPNPRHEMGWLPARKPKNRPALSPSLYSHWGRRVMY